MKPAALREGYEVRFRHCIVLIVTLKTQFHWRTNRNWRTKLQRTKMAERNTLSSRCVTGSSNIEMSGPRAFLPLHTKLQSTVTSNKSHQQPLLEKKSFNEIGIGTKVNDFGEM